MRYLLTLFIVGAITLALPAMVQAQLSLLWDHYYQDLLPPAEPSGQSSCASSTGDTYVAFKIGTSCTVQKYNANGYLAWTTILYTGGTGSAPIIVLSETHNVLYTFKHSSSTPTVSVLQASDGLLRGTVQLPSAIYYPEAGLSQQGLFAAVGFANQNPLSNFRLYQVSPQASVLPYVPLAHPAGARLVDAEFLTSGTLAANLRTSSPTVSYLHCYSLDSGSVSWSTTSTALSDLYAKVYSFENGAMLLQSANLTLPGSTNFFRHFSSTGLQTWTSPNLNYVYGPLDRIAYSTGAAYWMVAPLSGSTVHRLRKADGTFVSSWAHPFTSGPYMGTNDGVHGLVGSSIRSYDAETLAQRWSIPLAEPAVLQWISPPGSPAFVRYNSDTDRRFGRLQEDVGNFVWSRPYLIPSAWSYMGKGHILESNRLYHIYGSNGNTIQALAFSGAEQYSVPTFYGGSSISQATTFFRPIVDVPSENCLYWLSHSTQSSTTYINRLNKSTGSFVYSNALFFDTDWALCSRVSGSTVEFVTRLGRLLRIDRATGALLFQSPPLGSDWSDAWIDDSGNAHLFRRFEARYAKVNPAGTVVFNQVAWPVGISHLIAYTSENKFLAYCGDRLVTFDAVSGVAVGGPTLVFVSPNTTVSGFHYAPPFIYAGGTRIATGSMVAKFDIASGARIWESVVPSSGFRSEAGSTVFSLLGGELFFASSGDRTRMYSVDPATGQLTGAGELSYNLQVVEASVSSGGRLFLSGTKSHEPDTNEAAVICFRREFDGTLTDFLVTSGDLLGGGLSSLTSSDDNHLVLVCDEFVPNGVVQIGGVAPSAITSKLQFRCETRTSRPGVLMNVQVKNWKTNAWDSKLSVLLSQIDTLYSTTEFSSTGYIRPSDRRVECQLRFIPTADLLDVDGWSYSIDHLRMRFASD